MKKMIFAKSFAAVLAIGFFMLPMCVNAQYGPPEGFDPSQYGAPSGMDMSQYGPPSGTMGPPADVQEKMNKGLERLKKSAASMERAVKALEKAAAGAEKAGVTVPADVTSAITKAKAAIETIKNATEISDAVMDAIDAFNDFTEVLDANIENLMLLARFPKVFAQAQKSLDKLTKFFESTKLKLVNIDIDISENIKNIQGKIDALKKAYDAADAAFKAGKAEDAFTELQDNFFPGLEDASQSVGLLGAVKGISRAVVGIGRGIKTAEKIITRVARFGLDTTGLQKIVDTTKTKLAEFKTLISAKDFDLDAATTYLEDIDALREEFNDTLDGLIESTDKDVGSLPSVKFFTGPVINTPVDLKGSFDNFQDRAGKMGGLTGNGDPSEGFGLGDDMFSGFGE
jgi:hypothetical protein